jgi:hypothetical protein
MTDAFRRSLSIVAPSLPPATFAGQRLHWDATEQDLDRGYGGDEYLHAGFKYVE